VVNNPAQLDKVLTALAKIQADFNASATAGKRVSIADLIVLAGGVGVERGAKNGGHNLTVPFRPGRTDATDAMTDAASFAPLQPKADGFRNYLAAGQTRAEGDLLIDRAQLLGLSAPQMTVLIGGLRVLGNNAQGARHGVFTEQKETLSTDFFTHLLDMNTEWKKTDAEERIYEGRDRSTGQVKWTASPVDLLFGSNSQLRAIAEVYACDDAKAKFARDFVAAWTKVMELDRFELR